MRLLLERSDGGLSVMELIGDADPETCIAQFEAGLNGMTVISYESVEDSVVPTDRTFRGAWKKGVGQVAIDLTQAKAIWVDMWRTEREALLKKLDAEFTKAQGQKDQSAADAVEAKRQALRDVTKTDLSHIQNPTQLKQVWPAVLGEKEAALETK